MKLETIIGLEFHIQLKTGTKMFCSCLNTLKNKKPNENVCPVCLRHPGTLPVINQEAVNMAIKAGLALNCEINNFTKFDRKNYFYPDLPKGYQISQYDKPIAENGWLVINNKAADGLAGRLDKEEHLTRIGILRLHMEEDSAKSTHFKDKTLIDYNRSGAPLIEIVTKPHFTTPNEAKVFAEEMQLIMRHLEVSDANMELGQLRCDANISLRPKGETKLYAKTEIKNINSFKALEKALHHEIKRQTVLWTTGQVPTKEQTRGWDENKQETVAQRTKEQDHDYRYFPEPDIPPLTFTKQEIKNHQAYLTELPQDKRRRFMDMYELKGPDAKLLSADKELSFYFEQIISELKNWLQALESVEGTEEEIWFKHKKKLVKLVSNWLINKFIPLLTENNLQLNQNKISAENFAEFLTLIYQNKINSANAQLLLKQMLLTGGDPSHIMDEEDLGQINSEEGLDKVIEQVITENPDQVKEYQAGKEAVLKYFVGMVMKKTKGKADPQKAEEVLKQKIQSL